MNTDDEIKTLHSPAAPNPAGAVIDAAVRSAQAKEELADFFENGIHVERVERVQNILRSFFGEHADIRINHRKGKPTKKGVHNKPFTVLKVMHPTWPVSLSKKEREFNAPLEELDKIERRNGRNGLIIRIY